MRKEIAMKNHFQTMKIETHVHTKYSKDSLLCFWPLYLKCRLRGIDWIAITEHNNADGGLAFQKFCNKRGNKVHVIVGEEVFTDSGEIIGLYLQHTIAPGLTPEETIKEIRKQNGVVYVPHPYDEKRHKTVLAEDAIKRNKDLIDCIEYHNGRNISTDYDIKQKAIADKYGLTVVIGSDAHTLMEIGRNYMVCDKNDLTTPEGFKGIIESAEFHEADCLKFAHWVTKFAKTVTLIKRGKFSEICGIIIRKIKRSL